jgi:hypothetical protein
VFYVVPVLALQGHPVLRCHTSPKSLCDPLRITPQALRLFVCRAIAKVSGLTDFKLRSPADDVLYAEATELLTVGEITWL